MTKTNVNTKIISLIIVLAMLVCTLPLASIVSYATGSGESFSPEIYSTVTGPYSFTTELPDCSQGYLYVKFVPEISGRYEIYSEGNADPSIAVLDAEGNHMGTSDDVNGHNFSIERYFESGEVYYFKLCNYYEAGESTVIVKRICDEHTPGEQHCGGYVCTVCEKTFGEGNGNHLGDNNNNGYCDGCHIFYPNVLKTVTGEETFTITLNRELDGVAIVKFLPTESKNYRISSESESDPCLVICDENGQELFRNDDYLDLNFSAEYHFEAGVTYYLKMYDCDRTAEATISVTSACDEHTPGEHTCMGYVCTVCKCYFGDPGGAHNMEDAIFFYCNLCGSFSPPTDDEIWGEGSVITTTPTEEEGYRIIQITPSVDGHYAIYSKGIMYVQAAIYNSNGNYLFGDIYLNGYHFFLEGNLNAGESYFLIIYSLDEQMELTVEVREPCEEHTPGDQSCFGYECTVCGIYFGDAGDHVINSYSYDSDYHYGWCSVCDNYVEEPHEFDSEGLCLCGYFSHEHVFDDLVYDHIDHWYYCSLCGMMEEGGYVMHEYNEEGVCECGRERLKGVYLGTQLLLDGQYLDNEGNVSTTLPEGGYAYYKDGRLTLNNFSLINYDENPVYGFSAIYAETDIELWIVGSNYLESLGDDAIYIVNADLTIDGNGKLKLYSKKDIGEDETYSGDGIDVDGGNLVINGGTIIIDSSDHGIEVNGDAEINGGIIDIVADDDGIDVDNIVINGGIFYIDAEDNGIDSSYSTTINGGSFYISTNDSDAFQASEYITINDGIFETDAGDNSFDAIGLITVNGGYFDLASDFLAFVSEEGIVLGENMPDYEVVMVYEYYTLALDGEEISDITVASSDYDNRTFIDSSWIVYNGIVSMDNVEKATDVEIVREDGYRLVEGVDYTVSFDREVSTGGEYSLVLTGIGDYVGVTLLTVKLFDTLEINYGETVELPSYSDNDIVLEFTADIEATYVLSASLTIPAMISVLDAYGDIVSVVNTDADNGIYYEFTLSAGETYYLLFSSLDSASHPAAGEVTLSIVCPGHVGGEATYTERAICEICGDHYGDVRECPHMCHKDGIYAVIWGIFERIYDYLGIETQCECGHMH